MIHLSENPRHRRARLGGGGMVQTTSRPLCSNGSFHAKISDKKSIVDCPICLNLLVDYPYAGVTQL